MSDASQARSVFFISHPNVVISRDVPVPAWPLSEVGRARMKQGLAQRWVKNLCAIYCSTEQKAIDGARILAEHLSLSVTQLAGLGENDRSSTGFLPPSEFEAVANEFFANPETSIRGWERAIDAQSRIVATVEQLIASDGSGGDIAIVSHGAVGTLLYCKLSGKPVDRCHDQPANGGGNYLRFSPESPSAISWWTAID